MSDKIREALLTLARRIEEAEGEPIHIDTCAAHHLRAALAQQPAPVNKSVIRDVFLRNGFTIKEGQTDLKPYVYAAAEELLSLDGKAVAAAPAATVAQEPERGLVGYACDRRGALIQERCGDCLCWPAYENVATPAAERPDADDLVVWRITLPSGESCHFGTESMAKAWGHGSGKIERVDLKARPALELVAAEHPEMIHCACGDAYPAHSFGAGFIVAAGRCENCDASEQPDTVAVPRELLERAVFGHHPGHPDRIAAREELRTLLGKEGEA